MIPNLIKGLQDLLFPRNCLLCHQYILPPTEHIICPTCFDQRQMNRPPFCDICSRPIRKKQWDKGICVSCQNHPPHFDFAWGAYQYNPMMKNLIHAYKFHGKTAVRHLAGQLIRDFCEEYTIHLDKFDHIIPIPLHSARLRERGFNQSALIAKQLSNSIHEKTLYRIKNTDFQSHLGQKDRWTNIGEAFKISPLLTVEKKSILLIDDLLTTGATASEAAKTLKKAGASSVGVLTLAIA